MAYNGVPFLEIYNAEYECKERSIVVSTVIIVKPH
jgi:hypothetical protein